MYVQVGEVELPLQHLDRTKDIPARWPLVKDVLDKSKDQSDWENALAILEGLRSARINVPSEWKQKFVRRAYVEGMQHIILKALQRVSHTDLSLHDPAVLEFVMIGMRRKAQDGEWEEEPTKKALSFTEQILELMEHPDHCGGRGLSQADGRMQPFVSGTALELAAVRASRHTEGQDADGKVAKYAERLSAILAEQQPIEVCFLIYYEWDMDLMRPCRRGLSTDSCPLPTKPTRTGNGGSMTDSSTMCSCGCPCTTA